MSRALCVPFFRYQPHFPRRYRIFFEYFLKSLDTWGSEFDALYLANSGWDLTPNDKKHLEQRCGKVVVFDGSNRNHMWNQHRFAELVSEDHMLSMDMDMLIFRPGVVSKWFERAQDVDVLSAFDNSGGMKDAIYSKYPVMEVMDATRMGTYCHILNRKAIDLMRSMDHGDLTGGYIPAGTHIQELNYDVKCKQTDWMDNLGYFTLRILHKRFKLRQIHDNRSSIYLEDSGIVAVPKQNCDMPGYYHIRNGNLPIYLVDSLLHKEHRESFDRMISITPKREILRILAWYQYMGGDLLDIDKLLSEVDTSLGTWIKYYDEFERYHKL